MRILFFDLCTVLYTILCNNPLKHSSTARMLTKRSYRCRLRPAQLQEKTIEKNKKERTKRRHESTATTTTVVPPLCHRCATVVPSSQQTPPLTFACKCWDPWPNQSNIPLELPRSISLPHGAGTLICFHTATSSIFSFFS